MDQLPTIPPPAPQNFDIPNPLNTMEQMQGLALRGLEAQKAKQAADIQAAQFKANQSFGQILQSHIDPETGMPDVDQSLAIAAQHPETAPFYKDYLTFTQNYGKLDAERHKAVLDNNMAQLRASKETFIPLAARLGDPTKPLTQADIMGVFGSMRNFMPQEAVDKQMYDYLEKESKGLTNPNAYVRGSLLGTEQGLKALEQAQGTFKEQNELVPIRTPEGIKSVPRWQATQMMSQQNAAQGGVAPPAEGAARAQAQPSGPAPAASGYGYASEAEQEAYKKQADQFSTFMDKNAEGARDAQMGQMQITQLRQTLPKIEPYLGLLGTEKLNLAKLGQALDEGDEFGEVQSLLGVKSVKEARNVIANLEAFDKNTLLQNVEAAKTSIGPGNRMTNAEFTRFNKALLSMRMTAGGVKKVLGYMEKLNQLALDRNEFMQHFREQEAGKGHQFSVNVAEDAWTKWLMKHPESFKFEGVEEE